MEGASLSLLNLNFKSSKSLKISKRLKSSESLKSSKSFKTNKKLFTHKIDESITSTSMDALFLFTNFQALFHLKKENDFRF